MPASLHSRRGSYPAPLPYHQRTSKHHKSKPTSRWRRPLKWVIIMCTIIYLSLRIFSPSSTLSNTIPHYPELDLARQFHPIAPSTLPIPKIVHFVYGLKGPDPTLDWIHYLAIKSAHDRLEPKQIMFHYHYLPTGPVFDLARPFLTLHKVELASTTAPFGDQPVTHFAHQADLIRLAMLDRYGGIYLDLDVIVLASMDHLLDHEFIMGQEGVDGSVGLCNAVILSRPHARFLQRWQQTYRTFDQADWNYHSVVLPGKLATFFTSEITIMNHTTFFWPLWDSPGLRTLFLEKSYTFTNNLATHVWESAATPHLMAGLDPELIRQIDNSLYCQLRLLLPFDPEKPIRPCRILAHSPRSDQLIGSWPLTSTTTTTPVSTELNPVPALDESENEMHGIIRSGYFNPNTLLDNNDGVYTSGQDSYIFLSMPTTLSLPGLTIQWHIKQTEILNKEGTVLMVQTDHCKLFIKPTAVEIWIGDGWTWRLDNHIPANILTPDDQYHAYALVLGTTTSLLDPPLVLYKDGHVIASSSQAIHGIVRGLWFGSAEPNKYQDPWDTRPSLAAWYKLIKVWERALPLNEIRDPPSTITVMGSFKNADEQNEELAWKEEEDDDDD